MIQSLETDNLRYSPPAKRSCVAQRHEQLAGRGCRRFAPASAFGGLVFFMTNDFSQLFTRLGQSEY